MTDQQALSAIAEQAFRDRGEAVIARDRDVWSVYEAGNVTLQQARMQQAHRNRARTLGLWMPPAVSEPHPCRGAGFRPTTGRNPHLVAQAMREALTLDQAAEQAKGHAQWDRVERQAQDIEREPIRPDDQRVSIQPEASDGPTGLDEWRQWVADTRKTGQRQRMVRYPLTDDGQSSEASDLLCR